MIQVLRYSQIPTSSPCNERRLCSSSALNAADDGPRIAANRFASASSWRSLTMMSHKGGLEAVPVAASSPRDSWPRPYPDIDARGI